jgi:methyl-accepting chemotaxis protein
MRKKGLGFKMMAFIFLMLLFTAGTLIFFSYRTAYLDLEKSIGERLEAIAVTGALMLNGDLHNRIKSEKDEESEAFKKLQKILRDIKEKNNLEEEVCTFRREGDILKYIVMSHEKAFIGQTYKIRPEMRPTLNKGKSSHTRIFEDEHGIRLSAYAPIMDSKGHISGILDVDIELTFFNQLLQQKINRLILIGSVILIIGIVMSFLLSRRLVRNLKYLTDITEKISTGMMERSIDIDSKDEVGDLAKSLERMRLSLKMAMEMIDDDEPETITQQESEKDSQ